VLCSFDYISTIYPRSWLGQQFSHVWKFIVPGIDWLQLKIIPLIVTTPFKTRLQHAPNSNISHLHTRTSQNLTSTVYCLDMSMNRSVGPRAECACHHYTYTHYAVNYHSFNKQHSQMINLIHQHRQDNKPTYKSKP
jgi:hypothetical protein